MTWLSSILVSILCGALGLLCGGYIMNLCVIWYRVSSFEGKAGYAVVGVALLGGIAGLVIGLVATRIVAAGGNPTFLKGLGCASGSVLVIALVALGFCRLGADITPTMDGKYLEVCVEIRCPVNFPNPEDFDATKAFAELFIPGSRYLPSGKLLLDKAHQEDGRWIIPGSVALATRSSNKYLRVRMEEVYDLTFSVPLRSNPRKSDLEWSKWIDSGWDAGKQQPSPEERFSMRCRMQTMEPVVTDDSEDALPRPKLPESNAPLENFLIFFNQEVPEDQKAMARLSIEDRQEELARLIQSDDTETRELALQALTGLKKIRPLIVQALMTEAESIKEGIRQFNVMDENDPNFSTVQVELRSRFNYWKRAWWTTFHQLGIEGRSPIQEIHDLAEVRSQVTTMDEIVVNAQAVLNALGPANETQR
ncbi:MAG: hypothetical protein KJT03_18035 [Verrucomicrobiae bacterium]|nr:hypothetical protein [Verrucomicrobiae bacterium]